MLPTDPQKKPCNCFLDETGLCGVHPIKCWCPPNEKLEKSISKIQEVKKSCLEKEIFFNSDFLKLLRNFIKTNMKCKTDPEGKLIKYKYGYIAKTPTDKPPHNAKPFCIMNFAIWMRINEYNRNNPKEATNVLIIQSISEFDKISSKEKLSIGIDNNGNIISLRKDDREVDFKFILLDKDWKEKTTAITKEFLRCKLFNTYFFNYAQKYFESGTVKIKSYSEGI